MFAMKRAMGWAKANRRFTTVAVLVLFATAVGTAITVKQALAAPPYAYDYIPILETDPSVPPPIPNNGTGDASNSVVYPGQQLKFRAAVRNAGTAVGSPVEETVKMFMLDPNPGDPYYRAEAACAGVSCYNDPGHATFPQPGIVWPTQGYLYTFEPMPAIPPGQTFVMPPQTPASAPGYSLVSTIPLDAPAGRKFCYYAHTHPGNPDDLNPDGTNNAGYPDTGFGTHCYIVQSLGNGSCDGITLNPSILDPGTSFQITGRIRYNSASIATYIMNAPGTRFFVNITGPGVNRSYPNVTPITANGAVLAATTGLQAPTGQAGTYTVGYGIAGGSGAVNCSTTFGVAKRPYFKVNGGDISAGAGMNINGNECTTAGGVGPNQKAGIVGWNRGATAGYGGSGTTHGALTLGLLQGFATGQGSAYAPSGLAFANTGGGPGQINAAQQMYGGKFGSVNCVPDFWKNANNVIQGDTWINAQTIPNGTRQTIYVNGKVYITGNITFSGNYASLADVPSFTIVSRGNIYIERFVTQLDGFYISEPTSPTGNDGMFKTCAQFAFTPVGLDRNLQSTCDTPLTVNGGVVGRQIWLNRTSGTLSGPAAETFNYSPEFWVAAPFGNGLNPPVESGYDSITSLPPNL